MMYSGWDLTAQAIELILVRTAPIYPEVRCKHVTYDVAEVISEAPPPVTIRAYGVLDYQDYQVLAVTVDGKLMQPRKDRMFHVTISHGIAMPSSHAGVLLKEQVRRIKPIQPFLLPAVPFVRPLG